MALTNAEGVDPVEAMLAAAVAAAADGGDALDTTLQALDAPIYVTDADGWVISFNRACIDFAGRTPVAGHDRWCVSWRLYTESGDYLPHNQCPMATAIRQGRPIRGVVALAERPDGTRVMFTPYPTPILDADGVMTGAVNLLMDLTDERQACALDDQAARCRRLAKALSDARTIATLTGMATEYEAKARELRHV
ncbi:PAS domain-containing protein [Sphingosinicella sp.]|uniref:PAS domain-containing protein n=1 Tax=Sphingosinicella sp. TaxID=1917971 RepID=UPI004037C2B5